MAQQIRVDCYLSVLSKYKIMYPEAHFEVITRTAKSILSPSWHLLKVAKSSHWDFKTYREYFLEEIERNEKALALISELRRISKTKVVFLVCFEKNPNQCHRSIIKELIEKGDKVL